MKLGFAIVLTLLALADAGLGADRDLDTTIYFGRYFEVRNSSRSLSLSRLKSETGFKRRLTVRSCFKNSGGGS